MSGSSQTEIAIIGAGLLFPAKIESLEDLWNFLMRSGDASVEVPADRWSFKRFYSPAPQAAGKTCMTRGHFIIRDVNAFDCAIFGLSPREASLLDPLQRNVLFAAWRAVEDAKLAPSQIKGTKTGVYIGAFLDDFLVYAGRSEMRAQIQDHFAAVSSTAGMVSARLGHVFNLYGPAMSVDTACSSSMTAIVQACEALAQGSCEMAFAGGSSYMMIPEPAITMAKAGFLAKDGRSKSFSDKADGYGRGEGAGILLLKPLKKALEDGDPVRAVICAGALNQDGRTAAVPVPSQKAQALLMASLLEKSGLHPNEISAVEAHGAGTPVGDPIEAAAVSKAIAQKRSQELSPLLIGSIKANIGHLEASAGVAGVMRAMLSLEHKRLPPWPCEGKPADFLKEYHLHLPEKGVKLPKVKAGKSHYILANSFGYGGANAAVVLRSFAQKERPSSKRATSIFQENIPFVLSAATLPALKKQAKDYADFIEGQKAEDEPVFWRDVCQNVLRQRDLLTYRLVLLKEDRTFLEIAALLRRFAEADGELPSLEGGYYGEVPDSTVLETSCLYFGASPVPALREGAVVLLDLPSGIACKATSLLKEKQKRDRNSDAKAEIFEDLRQAGNFKALKPFSSAILQIAAAEFLHSLQLKLTGIAAEAQGGSKVASLIAAYFNDKVTASALLDAFEGTEVPALPALPKRSSASLVVMLGSGGGQPDFLALKRKIPLDKALQEVGARLLSEGAGIIPLEKGGRNLTLPVYPLGLEIMAPPERIGAKKDRVDLTVHPVLGTSREGTERSWKADLTTGFLPWLPDHAVQRQNGQAADWLFPCAAFVEAGLAAHKEMTGEAACILEDLHLQSPLFPARDLTSQAFWQFRKDTKKLSFASWLPASIGDENPWLPHGDVSILEAAPWGEEEFFAYQEAMASPEMEAVEISDFYQKFRRLGVYYGPSFRSVVALSRSGRKIGESAFGKVALPAVLQEKGDSRYLLHPVLLDGAFQMGLALLPEELEAAYAPCAIERFVWYGRENAKRLTHLVAKVTLTALTEETLSLDGTFYNEEGLLLGEMRGLECRALKKRKPLSLLGIKWELAPPLALLAEEQPLYIFGNAEGVSRAALKALETNGRKLTHFKTLSEIEACLQEKSPSAFRLLYLPQKQAGKNRIEEAVALLRAFQALLKTVASFPHFSLTLVGEGIFPEIETDFIDEKSLDLIPLLGFLRSARIEYPTFQFKTVFFEGDVGEISKSLAAEMSLEDFSETEVFLNGEGRFVPRIEEMKSSFKTMLREEISLQKLLDPKASNVALRLIRDEDGKQFTQGLGWEKVLLPPLSEGEIQVKTIAAGLNFKDFLNVMRLVPEFVLRNTHTAGILGMEALVEVEACSASDSFFKKGDLCLSFMPGAFESRRVLPADTKLLFPLPASFRELFPISEFKALAGFSIAALTAWGCLVRLAHLEAGETVLIHSAAGGVGQMALQIAQLRGVKIFATAGSPERRTWLASQKNVEAVFDSRSLAFYDEILAKTGGRGVDVVLNALTGEALTASLKLLAPFGRFVEIGKRDIVEGNALNLTPFNENLAFFSYDLDRMMKSHPEIAGEDLKKLYGLLLENKLVPPKSEFFPLEKVQSAFRHFSHPAHAGRIILDFSKEENVSENPAKIRENFKNTFFENAEAVHLVTGGSGGFGIETLHWLLENGARHLHVVSRKRPENRPEWKSLIVKSKKLGAEIVCHAMDISQPEKLVPVLKKITQKRPLGGIFHAAGVTEDAPLTDLSAEQISAVLIPKMGGAIALWQACKKLSLRPKYFMLYSSFVGCSGNSGQAAYAASNVFLDLFAAFLRQKGINAFSVGWGAIAEGGMTQNGNALALFRQSGIGVISAKQALDLMAVLAHTQKKWGAVVSIDWQAFFRTLPAIGREARFSLLNERENIEIGQALLSLPKSERKSFALKVILEEVSAILQLEAGGITPRTPLDSLGLDSLAGMELQVAVQKRLGVELPVSILATARTPDALAGRIVERTSTLSQNDAFGAEG
ncbi:SDR family NAD(P)-dependent oxidoreductase [Acetobacteraceae bacterium]|nr:SDR family NAD(P)-dependent oxidoreductase [Acetobacteraceae bacterium]